MKLLAKQRLTVHPGGCISRRTHGNGGPLSETARYRETRATNRASGTRASNSRFLRENTVIRLDAISPQMRARCAVSFLTLLSATALALVLPAAAQDQSKKTIIPAQHTRLTWEEHFRPERIRHRTVT